MRRATGRRRARCPGARMLKRGVLDVGGENVDRGEDRQQRRAAGSATAPSTRSTRSRSGDRRCLRRRPRRPARARGSPMTRAPATPKHAIMTRPVSRRRTNPRVSRRPYAELTARMRAFIAPESVQRASTKPTTTAVRLPPPLCVMRVSESLHERDHLVGHRALAGAASGSRRRWGSRRGRRRRAPRAGSPGSRGTCSRRAPRPSR